MFPPGHKLAEQLIFMEVMFQTGNHTPFISFKEFKIDSFFCNSANSRNI